jgi:hypothetical protein
MEDVFRVGLRRRSLYADNVRRGVPSSPREDNAEETGDGALAENRSAMGSSLYLYGKSIANFEDAWECFLTRTQTFCFQLSPALTGDPSFRRGKRLVVYTSQRKG